MNDRKLTTKTSRLSGTSSTDYTYETEFTYAWSLSKKLALILRTLRWR